MPWIGDYVFAISNCDHMTRLRFQDYFKILFQDDISTDDLETFHEDGTDDFVEGEDKMDKSRSIKSSAIIRIGNAQQVGHFEV